MAERDLSELDLRAAFRTYLEDAPTEVRPLELARHFAATYPRRRTLVGRWWPDRRVALIAAAALLLAVVAGALVGSRLTTEDRLSKAVPFHAVPDDSEAVWGTASCRASSYIGGFALSCELDMSDPRVSGTETIEQYRGFADGSGGHQWILGDDVITNAEGTWRGSSQGSSDAAVNPLGESHYIGEGAYEGLEFHYYFAQPEFPTGQSHLRGWIASSTRLDPGSSTDPYAALRGAGGSLVLWSGFHAITASEVAVSGTAVCDATGSGAVDPEGALDVLVTCQLDLSDPRVSGTETQDRFRILAGSVGAGDVRVADDARIATAEGTWSGSVQAATDDAAVPASIGEAHYVGEGAYEGLEFHYYFADLDSGEDGPVVVHGWISPAR
jgi:hypothetical protein